MSMLNIYQKKLWETKKGDKQEVLKILVADEQKKEEEKRNQIARMRKVIQGKRSRGN